MLKNRLLVAMAIAMMGAASAAMPPPRKSSSRDYKPRWPNEPAPESAMAREIAEHNAAVDARKAEKLAAKRARRIR